MTTATRSVAVVATRLPDIDRRALSQDWFSALHLAHPSAAGARVPLSPTYAPPSARTPKRAETSVVPALTDPPARTHAGSARPAAPAFAGTERRTAGDELARRVERAIVR